MPKETSDALREWVKDRLGVEKISWKNHGLDSKNLAQLVPAMKNWLTKMQNGERVANIIPEYDTETIPARSPWKQFVAIYLKPIKDKYVDLRSLM